MRETIFSSPDSVHSADSRARHREARPSDRPTFAFTSRSYTSSQPRVRLAISLVGIVLSGHIMSLSASGVGTHDANEYLTRVIQSLSFAKTGYDYLVRAHATSRKDGHGAEWSAALLLAYKRADADYTDARAQISPYTKSTDPMIKESAATIDTAYAALLSANDDFENEIKQFLNGNVQKPGALVERFADVDAIEHKAWQLLAEGMAAVGNALLELPPSGKEKITHLKITTEQRQHALSRLERIFGPSVRRNIEDMRDDETVPEILGVAMLLHGFLSQPWEGPAQ